MAVRSLLGAVLIGLVAVGCSSSSDSDAGDGVLRFTIVGEDDEPLPDAIVVVNAAGGSQFETTTDETGVAAFPEVDLGAGPVDVTAFKPSRALVTVLGLDAKSSKTLRLPWMHDERPRRSIDVAFVNKVASDDCVSLTAKNSRQAMPECGSAGVVEVPEGAGGKLIALEYAPVPFAGAKPPLRAAVAVDIPAGGDSVTVDFSKSPAIEHASGSFAFPDDLGMWFVVQLGVSVAEGGTASLTDSSSSNGILAWQTDFFRPVPDAEAVSWVTLASQLDGSNQARAVGAAVAGYPAPDSLALPPFPTAVTFTESTTLFSAFSWMGDDRPNRLILQPMASGVHFVDWWVWFASDQSTITPPRPPDSIRSQLDWLEDDFAIQAVYCEPKAGACGAGGCSPTQVVPCDRWALAVDTSHRKPPP